MQAEQKKAVVVALLAVGMILLWTLFVGWLNTHNRHHVIKMDWKSQVADQRIEAEVEKIMTFWQQTGGVDLTVEPQGPQHHLHGMSVYYPDGVWAVMNFPGGCMIRTDGQQVVVGALCTS